MFDSLCDLNAIHVPVNDSRVIQDFGARVASERERNNRGGSPVVSGPEVAASGNATLLEETKFGVPEDAARHDVHEHDVGHGEHGLIGNGDGGDVEHDHRQQTGRDRSPGILSLGIDRYE